MKTWLVTGAGSEIAFQICRLHAVGNRFLLVGRSQTRLAAIAADLCARGAVDVVPVLHDFAGSVPWSEVHREITSNHGEPDVFLVAQGVLFEAAELEAQPAFARELLQVNATSVVEVMLEAERTLQERKRGSLVVLGSVAGDRARPSNAAYGASKAVAAFVMEGLRLRNHQPFVRHLLVKLGPVDTPMTAGKVKSPLYADASAVARRIGDLIGQGKSGVVYVPGWWRLILLVIRVLPRQLLRRLSL